MATSINLTYYGMSGTGPTVREAKADAGRQIEQLVARTKEGAILVNVLGHVALVLAGSDAWNVAYLTDERGAISGNGRNGFARHVYGSGSYPDRDDALYSAVMGCAESGWGLGNCSDADAIHAGLECLPARMHARFAEEFRHWAKWQRSYRLFRYRGMTDSEAHLAACGHPPVRAG